MPRTQIPFAVADISALARAFRPQLEAIGRTPSHLELLNMLSRAAGHANYQHLRTQAGPVTAAPSLPEVDLERATKVAHHFDAEGRLLRWPARANHQDLALWVLWSRLPAGEVMSEAEIGALLTRWHVFGDNALLRRALFDFHLVHRTVDGREYRRIEQVPPPELGPLLARIAGPVAA